MDRWHGLAGGRWQVADGLRGGRRIATRTGGMGWWQVYWWQVYWWQVDWQMDCHVRWQVDCQMDCHVRWIVRWIVMSDGSTIISNTGWKGPSEKDHHLPTLLTDGATLDALSSPDRASLLIELEYLWDISRPRQRPKGRPRCRGGVVPYGML